VAKLKAYYYQDKASQDSAIELSQQAMSADKNPSPVTNNISKKQTQQSYPYNTPSFKH
jgi:Tfp pilus assembly protein PilF